MIADILVASTILLHVTIKLYSEYLEYQHRLGITRTSTFTNQDNNPKIILSKHTVSLGSALFFSLLLIGGLFASFGLRQSKLYFVIPLLCTTVSVFFPLLIIFSNQGLKQHFLKSLPGMSKNYFRSNRVDVVIWRVRFWTPNGECQIGLLQEGQIFEFN